MEKNNRKRICALEWNTIVIAMWKRNMKAKPIILNPSTYLCMHHMALQNYLFLCFDSRKHACFTLRLLSPSTCLSWVALQRERKSMITYWSTTTPATDGKHWMDKVPYPRIIQHLHGCQPLHFLRNDSYCLAFKLLFWTKDSSLILKYSVWKVHVCKINYIPNFGLRDS